MIACANNIFGPGITLNTVGRTRLYIDPDIIENDDILGW